MKAIRLLLQTTLIVVLLFIAVCAHNSGGSGDTDGGTGGASGGGAGTGGQGSVASSHTLSVVVNGNGTVISQPAGISCGTTCRADFPIGTTVTLTAASGAGATLVGFGGACTGTSACTIVMDTDRQVSVAFGGPGGTWSWGGVSFPWQVFDGTVPDVPTATGTGKTWYCDPVGGNDTWDGSSFTFVSGKVGPKKTLGAALTAGVKAGDTILLGGGIYREYPDFGTLSGKAGAPITIGSYGRGTGAPILDGGIKSTLWTKYTAQGQSTVWQTPLSSLSDITANQPVLGIYVNNAKNEYALYEVIHGQVSSYGGKLPPNETAADLKDGANKWFYNTSTKVLYADFGGTLGSGDPNTADVSILFNSHAASAAVNVITLTKGHDYINFIGLTIRAASWSGVYTESSWITLDHCDIKFNGGAAVLFGAAERDVTQGNNIVRYSRIWMNVLDNWPRFNNGNTGGGWPSALGWAGQSNGLSLGNVVYLNGGEGVDFTYTDSADGKVAHISVNNIVRNNIIFDNYSVNLYFVSTQNVKAEQNFVFNHPLDKTQTFDNLLEASAGYGEDLVRRMVPINVGLGDEPGSSFDGKASLAGITLINNVIVGGKRGIYDWDDGTTDNGHGLRDVLIANNTFVQSSQPLPAASEAYLWQGQSFPGRSSNSLVENNILLTVDADDFFIKLASGADTGITTDYNLYAGPGSWGGTGGVTQSHTQWKAAHPQWDRNSATGDTPIAGLNEFNQTAAQRPVYDWSKAKAAASPAFGMGTDLSTRFNTDFTGTPRPTSSHVVGAFAGP